tara:strand:- start:9673 stop:10638 length:966 start_codon:yes stop_codon:yes gene_type:complete
MNILLTGGAGYIGSKVAIDLLKKGHQVFIIDNLSKGKKKLIPKKSKFFKLDISNSVEISNIIKKNNIQTVFHFAALISVPESLKKPKKYYLNNYLKSKTFIKNCISNDIKYFIFSSTAAVYQSPTKSVTIKENFKKNPKNPYGASKWFVEKYIQTVKNKMKFCILRYFNVAGADINLFTGQISDNSNLFKNLAKTIVNKNNIFKIYGNNYPTKDGTAVRDFIHIEDLSNIHLKSLDYIKKTINKNILILNCGYGVGHSVYDIVSVAKKTYKLEYNVVNKRNGDLPFIVANCDKLKKTLKWKPKFNSIKTMIDISVKWEKKL